MRPIARLHLFIDVHELIRVGGRLSRSQLPEDKKHQILLAKTSHFSLLLIRHWHNVTGHSSSQMISSLVSYKFWILSIRTLIRTIISCCAKCVRLAVVNPQPVIADLPSSRVTEGRPFFGSWNLLCQPIINERKSTKARYYKAYVAAFVCFITRAVHLESVSDVSTLLRL